MEKTLGRLKLKPEQIIPAHYMISEDAKIVAPGARAGHARAAQPCVQKSVLVFSGHGC